MITLALIVGYSIAEIAIAIIVLAAVCALVSIALRQYNITIPPWVSNAFWVVVIAIVLILAVRIVTQI